MTVQASEKFKLQSGSSRGHKYATTILSTSVARRGDPTKGPTTIEVNLTLGRYVENKFADEYFHVKLTKSQVIELANNLI